MVGSMGTTIGTHRLRRWPNIKPSLIQYLMFAWYRTYKNKTINSSAANDAYYLVRIKFCNLFVSGSSGGGGRVADGGPTLKQHVSYLLISL